MAEILAFSLLCVVPESLRVLFFSKVSVHCTLGMCALVTYSSFSPGLVPRTFGIAPEKALKMQAWVLVGRWVDRHVDKPTITKWLMAGAAAGAATTLIGELHSRPCTGVCSRQMVFSILCYWIDRPFFCFSSLYTHVHALGSSILYLAQERALQDRFRKIADSASM